MISPAVRCALALAVLALGASQAFAGNRRSSQTVARDGTVHRVDEAVGVAPGGVPLLRHTITRPDGSTSLAIVTGTEDVGPDREPVLDIDPLTDKPLLAWSHNDGSGFDVMASRFDGVAWTVPRQVLGEAGADEIRPQLHAGSAVVQVVARRDTNGKSAYQRVVLDRETLAVLLGPEGLQTVGYTLPPEGDDGNSPEPVRDDAYFTSDLLRATPSDPGRIVVWGGRDEPVPIDFNQIFALPTTLSSTDVDQPVAEWIEGAFALSFTAANRLYYTVRLDGRWTEMRSLPLDEGTVRADARLLIADMIRREGSGAP